MKSSEASSLSNVNGGGGYKIDHKRANVSHASFDSAIRDQNVKLNSLSVTPTPRSDIFV